MSIYQHFSYEQLKIILSQNPTDTEAKKQLNLIETRSLKSKDIHFYMGPVLMIGSILMYYLELSPQKYSVLPMALLGVCVYFLNLDNYLLKRKFKSVKE